jgi:hypothetical protein
MMIWNLDKNALLSTNQITLKYLMYIPEAHFLGLPMESILVEEEVLSRKTGITGETRHNFWSDRWIALKYLQ